jgi:tetratricopeptide (TPR) repeat protein
MNLSGLELEAIPAKGIYIPDRALRLRRWRIAALTLFLVTLICFAFLPRARADFPKQGPVVKEALLQRARMLIEKDETDRGNMEMAVSLLEEYRADFKDDIRVPLYLAEAYYRMVDPTEDVQKGYPTFEKAGACALQALKMDPDRVEAHYWYGLFLLRKAQKVSIFQAYFVARQGAEELELVRKRMPSYEHGGASRVLGLLHYKAPAWSPFGDVDRAIQYEQEATRIAPDYLLNRLYLAEAYQKKGDKEAAIRECRKIISAPSSIPGRQDGNPFREKARSMLVALS